MVHGARRLNIGFAALAFVGGAAVPFVGGAPAGTRVCRWGPGRHSRLSVGPRPHLGDLAQLPTSLLSQTDYAAVRGTRSCVHNFGSSVADGATEERRAKSCHSLGASSTLPSATTWCAPSQIRHPSTDESMTFSFTRS